VLEIDAAGSPGIASLTAAATQVSEQIGKTSSLIPFVGCPASLTE
jgi:hypothetical protein